jgi:hypothetical protein
MMGRRYLFFGRRGKMDEKALLLLGKIVLWLLFIGLIGYVVWAKIIGKIFG